MNLKLKTIANLINKEDIVLDTCCDHAYLAIYLKKNNLCQNVYASDISKNALNNALANIQKNKVNIKTFLSDGFKNINEPTINTVIIAGVGTNTILDIINNTPKNIQKFIISSNNNYYDLRKKMFKKGFYIQKELIIKENNKYYPIMLFTKNKTKETKNTLKFGKSNNKEYYNYLLNKELLILNKIPKNHLIQKLKHQKNIKYLKKI